MSISISGKTLVAGVTGYPVSHSLSPLLHNAWIGAAGLDALYVPFSPPHDSFRAFVLGLAGGVIRGLNVTAPFKETALDLAHIASDRAHRAGAANLLLFDKNGEILADNTDGEGLLAAFGDQAPAFSPNNGPVVVLGAGGAARGAIAAFLCAGAAEVRIVNRGQDRALALADLFGHRVRVVAPADISCALADAAAIINATPLGLNGAESLDIALQAAPPHCVVMDMVYRPLRTPLLRQAHALGLATVDGLAMLIGQARPSFEAFFGRPPPDLDVRALAVAYLETSP